MEKSGYRIVRCPGCDLAYLDHEPVSDELEKFYSKDYFVSLDRTTGYTDYFECENYLKLIFRRRLKIIEKYRDSGRLLDVGCGPGFFLEVLSDRWQPFGIDISEFAAATARSRGLNVIQGLFDASLFEKEFFDAVTMWNTLEHFTDPMKALLSANAVLKPGGVLAFYTNDIGGLFARMMGKYWHMLLVPDHLFFFTRASLTKMLEAAGFSVIKSGPETLFLSADYLLEHFLKIFGTKFDRKNLFGGVKPALNRIYLPINLFDTLTVYARKETGVA